MFFGTVPTPCVEQILRVIPFDEWKGVHLCCSGTFKLEQAIHAKHPDVPIYSNDVSLWTNAIGSVLTQKPTKIIFRDKLQFIEDKLNNEKQNSVAVSIYNGDNNLADLNMGHLQSAAGMYRRGRIDNRKK